VTATDEWSASVQALVNVGRKPLAEALGLELPAKLAKERHMWRVVNEFVKRPFDPGIMKLLDEYRSKPPPVGTGADVFAYMLEIAKGSAGDSSAQSASAAGTPVVSAGTGPEPESSQPSE
jgi:hypothetical protein